MSVRTIVKMGNQQLMTPALPLENPDDPNLAFLEQLLTDMQDTMLEAGGIGIAAPQIGCHRRVRMFGFDASERYPDELAVPFTILINPSIRFLSEQWVDGWEGCLSVPGLRGLVPRCDKIEYTGYNQFGQWVSGYAEGFHARVIQHEYDHLDGILYPHRIKDLRFFGFEDEIN